MVDRLNAFSSEVTRVAKEVGTEGQLGGQAEVEGVAGTWQDLTDNVNFMASNLTDQVRNISLCHRSGTGRFEQKNYRRSQRGNFRVKNDPQRDGRSPQCIFIGGN